MGGVQPVAKQNDAVARAEQIGTVARKPYRLRDAPRIAAVLGNRKAHNIALERIERSVRSFDQVGFRIEPPPAVVDINGFGPGLAAVVANADSADCRVGRFPIEPQNESPVG